MYTDKYTHIHVNQFSHSHAPPLFFKHIHHFLSSPLHQFGKPLGHRTLNIAARSLHGSLWILHSDYWWRASVVTAVQDSRQSKPLPQEHTSLLLKAFDCFEGAIGSLEECHVGISRSWTWTNPLSLIYLLQIIRLPVPAWLPERMLNPSQLKSNSFPKPFTGYVSAVLSRVKWYLLVIFSSIQNQGSRFYWLEAPWANGICFLGQMLLMSQSDHLWSPWWVVDYSHTSVLGLYTAPQQVLPNRCSWWM